MIQEVDSASTTGEFEIKPIELPPEPDYEIFDTKRIRLFTDESGKCRLTVEADRSYPDVNVLRCFPHSMPNDYWAITDRTNRVVGIIRDPSALDSMSYETAQRMLSIQYFLPVVTAVYSIQEEFGAFYFDIETNLGRRTFVAKGVRDSVDEHEDGEIIITDVDENRYVIRDWASFDAKSRKHLSRIV
ncbi:MAG TPA: DUF1854 domain-containing protein [Firmicutes bacterium]|nr:DUF1854 domain-containing protein [Bacillota bacterium]